MTTLLPQAKRLSLFGITLLAGLSHLGAPVGAQQPGPEPEQTRPGDSASFYREVEPFEMTLTAPFRPLRRDRNEESSYHEATVSYLADGQLTSIPVRVRTRGIWRKANCDFPPIMVDFRRGSTEGTVFRGLDRERLTVHCKDNDTFEQYVLQEYQLYRVQRLLTPLSYDVRLVRLAYVDSETQDTVTRRWAFLSERDEAFAARVGVALVELQGASPDDLQPYESAFLGVFQYFVGNTDYSISALHNVVLVRRGIDHLPVARDFDWSGAVNAQYAKPNPVLGTRSVTQRVMRGYCAPAEEYEKVFQLFRDRKQAIYALYRDPVAAPLEPSVLIETLRYFDDFYETIDDPRAARRNIIEACRDP